MRVRCGERTQTSPESRYGSSRVRSSERRQTIPESRDCLFDKVIHSVSATDEARLRLATAYHERPDKTAAGTRRTLALELVTCQGRYSSEEKKMFLR